MAEERRQKSRQQQQEAMNEEGVGESFYIYSVLQYMYDIGSFLSVVTLYQIGVMLYMYTKEAWWNHGNP